MTIEYQPKEIIEKSLSSKKIKKLITSDLKLNKAVLATLSSHSVLPKKELEIAALNILKKYRKRFKAGETLKVIGTSQLVNVIQNMAMQETTSLVKEAYMGEFYEWLPSEAENPDPEHQLKYGKKFQIGKGEMPQDRYGCKCGMRILTKEEELDFE